MKTLLASLCFVFLLIQLQASSIPAAQAPDFVITDTEGVEHQLYQYLSQGKSVILNFSSTWCRPCWNYKESGILDEVWNSFGPEGTNEVVVLFLEADKNTCEDCLYGQDKCNDFTYGNWATSAYPTSDLEGDNRKILDIYDVKRFPSIYAISAKDFSVKLMGQLSYFNWKDWLQRQREEPAVALLPTLEFSTPLINNFTASRMITNVSTIRSLEPKDIEPEFSVVPPPNNLQIYPNPCFENIFIDISENIRQPLSVTAFNMQGARVLKRKVQPNSRHLSIDLESLQVGPYVFIIRSGLQVWTKKVFIVR